MDSCLTPMEVFKKTFKALVPTTSAAGAANSNSEGNLKSMNVYTMDILKKLFCVFFHVAFHLERWVVVVPVALREPCPWSHKPSFCTNKHSCSGY